VSLMRSLHCCLLSAACGESAMPRMRAARERTQLECRAQHSEKHATSLLRIRRSASPLAGGMSARLFTLLALCLASAVAPAPSAAPAPVYRGRRHFVNSSFYSWGKTTPLPVEPLDLGNAAALAAALAARAYRNELLLFVFDATLDCAEKCDPLKKSASPFTPQHEVRYLTPSTRRLAAGRCRHGGAA
jgi:hypothetical protein